MNTTVEKAKKKKKKLRKTNTIKINPSVIYIRPNKTRYDFCGRMSRPPVRRTRGRRCFFFFLGGRDGLVYVNLGECALLDSSGPPPPSRVVISFQFPKTRAGEIVDPHRLATHDTLHGTRALLYPATTARPSPTLTSLRPPYTRLVIIAYDSTTSII